MATITERSIYDSLKTQSDSVKFNNWLESLDTRVRLTNGKMKTFKEWKEVFGNSYAGPELTGSQMSARIQTFVKRPDWEVTTNNGEDYSEMMVAIKYIPQKSSVDKLILCQLERIADGLNQIK